MSFGFGFGFPKNYIATLFNPAQLFTGTTNGAWYDPSDINLTWRRNLLTYSEQFDNAAWTKHNALVISNTAISPLGDVTADKFVESNNSAFHGLYRSDNVSLVSGNSYTFSAYVKAAERTVVRLISFDLTEDKRTAFNLSTASVVSSSAVSSAITPIGAGWYRISHTFTATASGSTQYAAQFTLRNSAGADLYQGDGYSGIYLWGAQLELGNTATPYQRITDGIKDYLDYKPLPVLYQDAAGTTPVTAVGQPVGLMLDKSKGLVPGPELVTNGDFSNGTTGWGTDPQWVISGGVATATASSPAQDLYQVSRPSTAGKTYKVSFDVTVYTSGQLKVRIGGATQQYSPSITSAGEKTYYFVADSASFILYFEGVNGAAFTGSIDNISVRELPGNHAFNSSGNSANFPVLSARYNLLTKTEDFSNAVWLKNSGGTGTIPTLTATVVAPDGTNTATQVVFDVGAGTTSADQSTIEYYAASGSSIGVSYKSGIFVKGAVGAQILIRQQGASSYTKHILTGNWDYLSQTETAAISSLSFTIGLRQAVNGTINSSITVSIWHPDLRVANDALNQPAYQRVNTATDYDTVGFKPYLSFNGVNQWLQTNSIDFSYGDKMFVSAGVRKLSDASSGLVFELSASYANIGTFALAAPYAANQYAFVGRASLSNGEAIVSSFPAPVTNIVTASYDFAKIDLNSGEIVPRVNGTTPTTNFTPAPSTNLGAGTFGNYPLYIGARAGTSFWFNGRLYGLVVAGKAASASEIASTETWLNQKTGAY